MRSKLLVCIVDDDEAASEALVSLVRSFGFEVQSFVSSSEFLASSSRLKTDCLIADIQMQRMDGIALFQSLKSSETPIPTILVTAHMDDAVYRRALDAGVRCCLSKSVLADRLLKCIQNAVHRRGKGE